MDWTLSAAVAALVLVASFSGTGAIMRFLRDRAIFDHPNERSSHVLPTPKGAGLAVVPVVAAAWLGAGWMAPVAHVGLVVGCALALAALSWLDDLRGLSPLLRLAGQAAAIAAVLAVAPPPGPVFAGLLPGWLDLVAAGLLWLWFVNLFNFMDGIDGIAGVETSALGFGVALVTVVAGLPPAFFVHGLALACAALGFLRWNWHPAKIFLGDVGSVPLGFLLGWLLIGLAAAGQWAAALILPLYYLADATITLLRRALRGEPVWQAHREHFYQLAVGRGLSHAQVVGHVLWVDVVLVALAVVAAGGLPEMALAGALVVVAWLLFFLGAGARPGT
jgi:UDP-N-acetylmuramyl pentapeptide phosphotransferase/UDP-N-acetylglucosamine-1-phosphate transferase